MYSTDDLVQRAVQALRKMQKVEAAKVNFAPAELSVTNAGVGDDAAEALAAARKMEATLKAKALGVAVKSSLPETPSNRIKLADAIAEYKAETKEHKSRRTYLNYARAVDLLAKGCPKTYVDEVG
jgi:hypothetical protein